MIVDSCARRRVPTRCPCRAHKIVRTSDGHRAVTLRRWHNDRGVVLRLVNNFQTGIYLSCADPGIFVGGGGSNFFQGGSGSNCLFPIETHITCDFPGVVRTPCPPLDAHLLVFICRLFHFNICLQTMSILPPLIVTQLQMELRRNWRREQALIVALAVF